MAHESIESAKQALVAKYDSGQLTMEQLTELSNGIGVTAGYEAAAAQQALTAISNRSKRAKIAPSDDYYDGYYSPSEAEYGAVDVPDYIPAEAENAELESAVGSHVEPIYDPKTEDVRSKVRELTTSQGHTRVYEQIALNEKLHASPKSFLAFCEYLGDLANPDTDHVELLRKYAKRWGLETRRLKTCVNTALDAGLLIETKDGITASDAVKGLYKTRTSYFVMVPHWCRDLIRDRVLTANEGLILSCLLRSDSDRNAKQGRAAGISARSLVKDLGIGDKWTRQCLKTLEHKKFIYQFGGWSNGKRRHWKIDYPEIASKIDAR